MLPSRLPQKSATFLSCWAASIARGRLRTSEPTGSGVQASPSTGGPRERPRRRPLPPAWPDQHRVISDPGVFRRMRTPLSFGKCEGSQVAQSCHHSARGLGRARLSVLRSERHQSAQERLRIDAWTAADLCDEGSHRKRSLARWPGRKGWREFSTRWLAQRLGPRLSWIPIPSGPHRRPDVYLQRSSPASRSSR
jgi:hypothetical protein